jgi:predicted ATPase/class 3 adenylate cyclase
VSAPSSTLTYLFTDVESSTSQWETDDDMHDRVEAHFAILHDCVVTCGGEVFATMGDGVAAAFDSAAAAVDAAVTAQRRLPGTGLRVRMGLHTGETRRVGDDFRGRALNRTARIMSAGHGGQVLVSDVTATLLRTGPDPVGLVDLGVHQLPDLAEPEHLWQVRASGLDTEFAPLRGTRTRASGLPRHRTSFVGRRPELAQVAGLVRSHAITTLTGPGGAGKTRLAVRVAREVMDDPDHVWFADLAPVRDPERAGEAVARAVGIEAGIADVGLLAAMIGSRHALLLLDNCEQVLDGAAALADRLTADCANLRVLATSREPLAVAGEFVVSVRGLDPETDAADLFEQRAEAAGNVLDEAQRTTVERICERLGGLPLAIELAAARVPMLGLQGVEALLDRPFDVLVSRNRGGDERHRTMFAAIDWSYQMLDDDERRLLEALAVFHGGFELDAVLYIAGRHGHDVNGGAELLDALVRRSLLEVDDEGVHVRYRMLESIRAFATERLVERGELRGARLAHVEWMASITACPFAEPMSPTVERSAVRLEREVDNWVAALTTATDERDPVYIERLCTPAVAHFLASRHELTGVLERAGAVCPSGTPRRAVACALASAYAGAQDPNRLRRWAAELRRLDGRRPSATTSLIEWVAHVWDERTDDGVLWCIAAAREPSFSQDARDLFVGIATIDRFSLTSSTDDHDWLLACALDVIDRTDVAVNRVVCRLGAAWALRTSEPAVSMQLVQEATAEIEALPRFLRCTLPGNVSRFMASLDPALGAEYLLGRIGDADGTIYLDTIPVAYAAALLVSAGHPAADRVLATIAAMPGGTYLARLELERRGRDALRQWPPMEWAEMVATVRAALQELAGSGVPAC